MEKRLMIFGMIGLLTFTASQAKELTQTVCFSKVFSGNPSKYFPNGVPVAQLGDNVKLLGGECQTRTLPEMNKDGWKLTQVITGLQGAFGMLLTKEK